MYLSNITKHAFDGRPLRAPAIDTSVRLVDSEEDDSRDEDCEEKGEGAGAPGRGAYGAGAQRVDFLPRRCLDAHEAEFTDVRDDSLAVHLHVQKTVHGVVAVRRAGVVVGRPALPDILHAGLAVAHRAQVEAVHLVDLFETLFPRDALVALTSKVSRGRSWLPADGRRESEEERGEEDEDVKRAECHHRVSVI